MKAEIIAVGSELLTPDRLDTNSLFLTEELNRIGIEVVRKTDVGDNRDLLSEAFRGARAEAAVPRTGSAAAGAPSFRRAHVSSRYSRHGAGRIARRTAHHGHLQTLSRGEHDRPRGARRDASPSAHLDGRCRARQENARRNCERL